MDKIKHPIGANVLVSSGLAMASLGDSFLYVYLPANYTSLGISSIWVGVLLSVNRLSRLFFNGWVAFKISHYGIKTVTFVAAIIAVITTAMYGFVNSIFFWLLARILWGLAFSTFRLSTLVYAVQHSKKGIAIGISKAIIALGPIIALMFGPFLLSFTDRLFTFLIFSLAGVFAIYATLKLPELSSEKLQRKDLFLSFPSMFNILVLINSIVEGIAVILTAQILFSGDLSATSLLFLVGFFLSYRRICLVIFSPLAGWLADRWGFENLFNYTTFSIIIGLVFLAFDFGITGLVITFTFSAMNAAIAPGGSLKKNGSMLKEFSDNATWRDIGTAAGTLVGGLFLGNQNLSIIFSSSGILLLIGVVAHIKLINKQKQVQWK